MVMQGVILSNSNKYMNSFESHIQGGKPVIVDFFAEWCGPCKMMAPVLHEVKEHLGDKVTILKMDIDLNPMYAQLYGVQSVPTTILFRNGDILWRKTGLVPAHTIIEAVRLHTFIHH
jgi:thioredoxin 1